MRRPLSERGILLVIGVIQFVNVLDFMMVLPLGPDFGRALGIPTSKLGLVGGSYTAAAALSGILGSLVLDRFDRRKALGVAMGGLVLGTAAGALATSFASMLAARLLAGACGGPTAALSLAVVGDVVPPERRGRAMGAVMGAFAISSVVGVPAALELARLGSWRLPFYAVAALSATVAVSAVTLLPPLRRHLEARRGTPASTGQILLRPTVALALLVTAALMTAQFALVPNIAAYWQYNLAYPRERLGLLFISGGAASFASMRLAGWIADRLGAALATAGATAVYAAVVLAAFVFPGSAPPALALFVGFMVASSFRMVPMQALSSRVPEPEERARFLSAQSAVQHLGAATGAFLGAGMLQELPDGRLGGIDRVAWLAVALAASVPLLLWVVELRVPRLKPAALAAVRSEEGAEGTSVRAATGT